MSARMTEHDQGNPSKPPRYRVRRNGTRWEWEIRTAEGRTVAHGAGATSAADLNFLSARSNLL
jgi:hypothetical protein